MSGRMALEMGLLLQVWYFVASFLTWYTIDRVGRRFLFISCALGMCLVLVAEAICVAIDNRASNIAAVFWVFAFEAFFTWGWMACVWVYPPEILPLKIRAKGAAIAAAADFAGNFLVVEVTPVGIASIGFGFYLVWAATNLIMAVIVWLFYPETAGLPLESIDLLFTDRVAAQDLFEEKQPFYRKVQWDVVGKAAAEQKRLKQRIRSSGRGGSESSMEEADVDVKKDSAERVEHIRT